MTMTATTLLNAVAAPAGRPMTTDPSSSTADSTLPRIPIGQWFESGVQWVTHNMGGVLDAITDSSTAVNDSLTTALLLPNPLLMVGLFALISWLVRSWRLAIGTALTFLLIISLGQWANAMETLSLVILATLTALVIAIPLGICAAKSKRFSAAIKPVLDLMQTMPAFVYLIPAVLFFGIGAAPGMFATVVFAMPPGVRMTELGIRQVDSETVEASRSFGATEWQLLKGVQIPLAIPTIMAGVNQVIMLALSMAVIAGMVGSEGLGKEVAGALASIQISLGVEAGLCIVFLAIFLDRLTAALGNPALQESSILAMLRRTKTHRTA